MKIVFVNRFFYPDHSATSQLLSDLAFHLALEGREVLVITSRQRYDEPNASLPAREVVCGVIVRRLWTSCFGRGNLVGRALDYLTFYLGTAITLLHLASRGDVIVAKTDPPLMSLVGWPIARIKGARLVNWLQDVFPEIAVKVGVNWAVAIAGRLLTALRDGTLRSAQMNIVLGTAMERFLVSRGVGAERVRIIPNWADGDSIRPVASQDNDLRKSWGLEASFVVGYSGNMGRVHEFETILQAAARLKERNDIAFLFIGNGARRKWIEQRARELALGQVQFRPYQPREQLGKSLSVPNVHLVSLLPEVEGLVFPSKLYGILAAGRPVLFVGRREGEIRRLIDQERIGAAVACGNDAGLAEIIVNLAADPTRVKEMGARARKLFEQRYASGIALSKWVELLDAVHL